MTLQPETWTHELGRRVRTLMVLKMLANLGGIAAFFYAYFWIMRHPLSAATVIPVTWIDDLVPFSPQSFFLYVALDIMALAFPPFPRAARAASPAAA